MRIFIINDDREVYDNIQKTINDVSFSKSWDINGYCCDDSNSDECFSKANKDIATSNYDVYILDTKICEPNDGEKILLETIMSKRGLIGHGKEYIVIFVTKSVTEIEPKKRGGIHILYTSADDSYLVEQLRIILNDSDFDKIKNKYNSIIADKIGKELNINIISEIKHQIFNMFCPITARIEAVQHSINVKAIDDLEKDDCFNRMNAIKNKMSEFMNNTNIDEKNRKALDPLLKMLNDIEINMNSSELSEGIVKKDDRTMKEVITIRDGVNQILDNMKKKMGETN